MLGGGNIGQAFAQGGLNGLIQGGIGAGIGGLVGGIAAVADGRDFFTASKTINKPLTGSLGDCSALFQGKTQNCGPYSLKYMASTYGEDISIPDIQSVLGMSDYSGANAHGLYMNFGNAFDYQINPDNMALLPAVLRDNIIGTMNDGGRVLVAQKLFSNMGHSVAIERVIASTTYPFVGIPRTEYLYRIMDSALGRFITVPESKILNAYGIYHFFKR